MIHYDEGDWQLAFIFQRSGSVVPKALCFAVPSAVLAFAQCYWTEFKSDFKQEFGTADLTESQIWNALTAMIVILLSFRTRQALGRFWEGTGLLHQMRGEWFDAISCLMAFSRHSLETNPEGVWEFRHTLVRLTSLMHGCALHELKDIASEHFEVLDLNGLDKDTLDYLRHCKDLSFNRFEALLHMIHVLITENDELGVIDIAPPILSRVYQELSRGMVNLHNAKKITDTQFPFPYAQLMMTLLLLHAVLTPMVFSGLIVNPWWAAVVTLVPIFGMFSINFVATELEMPFGDDDNDLPLQTFQADMNTSLVMLIHENADLLPTVGERAVRNFDDLCKAIDKIDVGSVTSMRRESVKMTEPAQKDAKSGPGPPGDEGRLPPMPCGGGALPGDPMATTLRGAAGGAGGEAGISKEPGVAT